MKWIISLIVWGLLLPAHSFAALDINMPRGVTPVSHDIYDLHMTAFAVSCVIALVVFSLITYSLIKFRKSKHPRPAHFKENLTIEVIWTAIPFIILICLAIPATRILGRIHDTQESELTIKVTGYQWKWQYEYLDHDIKFFSFLSTPLDQIYNNQKKNEWYLLEVDKPLVVPVDTKIKLLITSQDVVHDWWVPSLGIKQDAIPGYINQNWINISKPGIYRGQCGELCGVNHAFMPVVVKAISKKAFNQWVIDQHKASTTALKKKPRNMQQLLADGKREYDQNCIMCHRKNGEGIAYNYPALKKSRVVTGPIDETILYVMRGVPSAAMQAFGKILDDRQIAAVITYVRTQWGNKQIIEQENYRLQATEKDVAKMRLALNNQ